MENLFFVISKNLIFSFHTVNILAQVRIFPLKIQSDEMVEKCGNSFCFTTEAFITVILLKKVLICCQHFGFLSFSGKALKNDSRHKVKRDFVKKNDPLQKFCQNLDQTLLTHSIIVASQACKPIILNYLWVSLFQTAGLFQEFFLLDEALKSKEMSRISVSKPGNQQIAPCSPGFLELHKSCTAFALICARPCTIFH